MPLTDRELETIEYKLKKPFSELLYQMTQYFHTVLNIEQVKQLGADFGVKDGIYAVIDRNGVKDVGMRVVVGGGVASGQGTVPQIAP